jgi:hypothetical protein
MHPGHRPAGGCAAAYVSWTQIATRASTVSSYHGALDSCTPAVNKQIDRNIGRTCTARNRRRTELFCSGTRSAHVERFLIKALHQTHPISRPPVFPSLTHSAPRPALPSLNIAMFASALISLVLAASTLALPAIDVRAATGQTRSRVQPVQRNGSHNGTIYTNNWAGAVYDTYPNVNNLITQ